MVEPSRGEPGHRPGLPHRQTQDVHVHKLICVGTLEDRIDHMIEMKQETADQVVGTTSERWLTELSNTELRDVLALSATPAD